MTAKSIIEVLVSRQDPEKEPVIVLEDDESYVCFDTIAIEFGTTSTTVTFINQEDEVHSLELPSMNRGDTVNLKRLKARYPLFFDNL